MAQDWPGYLWAVATTALLVKETHKLIFRHPQEVYTPYQELGKMYILPGTGNMLPFG